MNKNEVLRNLYLLSNVKTNSKNIKLTIVGGEWKKAKIIVVQKCVFFALNVNEMTMINNQKMDKHTCLYDEKLVLHSTFIDISMNWNGCNNWKHYGYYFAKFSQVQRFNWRGIHLLMGMFTVWWWFYVPRPSYKHYFVQVKDNTILYFISLHCMKQKINPVIIVLSKLSPILCIETMFQALYICFAHNPKKCLKLFEVVETFPTMLPTRLITKGQKLFRNIKTHWISMLSPKQHDMLKYKSLIVKMNFNSTKKKDVQSNLILFTNLELSIGLSCLLPMLKVEHMLIKFV